MTAWLREFTVIRNTYARAALLEDGSIAVVLDPLRLAGREGIR